MMDVIPTGSIKLDIALGTGGIHRGEIAEIYGSPSAGKSTLALQIVAQAQKRGLWCMYMDVENELNPTYAVCCGVDEVRMLLARPRTGDDALEMSCLLLHTKDIDLVIIDSLAALVSEKEIRVRERAWGN
ncbi:MAG: ATPase domain-containing protein [Anaerolineales bacterium]